MLPVLDTGPLRFVCIPSNRLGVARRVICCIHFICFLYEAFVIKNYIQQSVCSWLRNMRSSLYLPRRHGIIAFCNLLEKPCNSVYKHTQRPHAIVARGISAALISKGEGCGGVFMMVPSQIHHHSILIDSHQR